MKVKLISYKLGWQRLTDDPTLNFELTVETLFLKRKLVVQREIGMGVSLSELVGQIIII